MAKKTVERKTKEERFREIEQVLVISGEHGKRIAAIAKELGISKSYAHGLLIEMVHKGLLERAIKDNDDGSYHVNYRYYQLPLWDTSLPYFPEEKTETSDNQFLAWECEDCGTLSDGATCSICGGDNEYHG